MFRPCSLQQNSELVGPPHTGARAACTGPHTPAARSRITHRTPTRAPPHPPAPPLGHLLEQAVLPAGHRLAVLRGRHTVVLGVLGQPPHDPHRQVVDLRRGSHSAGHLVCFSYYYYPVVHLQRGSAGQRPGHIVLLTHARTHAHTPVHTCTRHACMHGHAHARQRARACSASPHSLYILHSLCPSATFGKGTRLRQPQPVRSLAVAAANRSPNCRRAQYLVPKMSSLYHCYD